MPSRNPYPNETIECACGCGQTLERYAPYLRNGNLVERKYIHGHNAQKKKVTYNCDNCGKEITVPAYMFDRVNHHFCSYECSGIYSQKRETIKCAYCNCDFSVAINRKDSAVFCSKECQLKSTEIIVKCNYCGKELNRQPSTAKGNCYCNQECQHKWLSENICGENHPLWEGGHGSYRGGQWRIKRKAALARDGYKCKLCNSTDKLCVHHIRKYVEFDNPNEANELDNLITLCISCHAKVEPKKKNRHLNESLKQLISPSAAAVIGAT